MTETPTATRGRRRLGPLGSYLGHDNVFVRVVSLWLGGVVLFSGAWITSYYLLPERALSGVSSVLEWWLSPPTPGRPSPSSSP